MSEKWLEGMIKKLGKHCAPSYFRAFLVEEHTIVEEDRDEKTIKAL